MDLVAFLFFKHIISLCKSWIHLKVDFSGGSRALRLETREALGSSTIFWSCYFPFFFFLVGSLTLDKDVILL